MSLNPAERKAATVLKSYFSKDPIVFDVGSNKGFWTDILVNNVSEMHLFEPNKRLLTYTMVKYDYLKNVIYNNEAVSDRVGVAVFTVFYNENNGLSNIIHNPKWDYLPGVLETVETTTIDDYCDIHIVDHIDFMKIDVEGAEMKVLEGASETLQKKRVKFIQIEKSEHYDFTPLPDYVRGFGYDIFHFDGENFVKWNDQEAENLYIMDKEFTQDWNGEFRKNTEFLKGKVHTALEIGCFEGLTTNYICDYLLNEGGRVVCIDPLTEEYLPGHKDNEMFKGQYERFIRNTKGKPVELIREQSRKAHNRVKDLRFNLIYVDGDHTEDGVFMDGVMYWNQLLDTRDNGGYMLFDDYEQSEETKRGVDRFLHTQEGNYKLIHKGYQVLIQRMQ